jgi:hypothetical protein
MNGVHNEARIVNNVQGYFEHRSHFSVNGHEEGCQRREWLKDTPRGGPSSPTRRSDTLAALEHHFAAAERASSRSTARTLLFQRMPSSPQPTTSRTAVTLKRVLSTAKRRTGWRMVILDAGRNNPFRMASAEGRARAISRGLSRVEPRRAGRLRGPATALPPMTATAATVRLPSRCSPIWTDLEINLLFRRVRDQVLARTNNGQEPFTHGSLRGRSSLSRRRPRARASDRCRR